LGAWGLGWEVWLDGQEITQFTYFQQAGGQVLEPVAVEITYGLERIAMALQKARDFRALRWNEHFTYGDVHLQSEQEFSKYAFEVADVERLRQAYTIYAAEAEAALVSGLVLPAHDYVLKCSHTFNLLDTRGAIGVTERQGMFGRMRDLSRRTAQLYLEQRQRLEFPWLAESAGLAAVAEPMGKSHTVSLPMTQTPQPLLFEIGTEEMPAADLEAGLEQLRRVIPELMTTLRLEYGSIKVIGTPRRLVVSVENLAPRQADLEQVVKGPPADRALDASGVPTKAAEGFARSRGVAVEDLQVVEMDGGRYVAATVRQVGRPTIEVLADALPQVIAGLKFDRSMRWNQTNVAFSRPIRWLLALYGSSVVPFEYAGLVSGRLTRGLRFVEPVEISVEVPVDYFAALKSQGIILDPNERKAVIAVQVQRLASGVHGQVPDDPALLDEVNNLVEAPTALRGEFEHQFLELPREVLISVMRKHQRYFPVFEQSGEEPRLLPNFIAVRNGDEKHLDLVTQGNADVIRARFADASYFIRADLKKPLHEYLPRLNLLTFQKDLGSMLDKTHRLVALVEDLALILDLSQAELEKTRRAALLCKADLATHMVVEMTSLQGVMGRYYAQHSGESADVANAIYEHYLPRFTGDTLPLSKAGLLVGLADRLDSLAGLFAVGLAPTGAKDPFAQRRAALGLVQSLIGWNLDMDIQQALRFAGGHLPVRFGADELSACLNFITERLRNSLLDQGYRHDVVDAVVLAQGRKPAGAARAVKELTEWVNRPDWHTILPAYARCVRITRDLDENYMVSPEAFVDEAEKALCKAIKIARVAERHEGSVGDMLKAFLPMIEPINLFFDRVLVMAEDPVLRTNRLGMLQMIASMADEVADFSHLEGF
jgi:glycyl-tRNA synthetase